MVLFSETCSNYWTGNTFIW